MPDRGGSKQRLQQSPLIPKAEFWWALSLRLWLQISANYIPLSWSICSFPSSHFFCYCFFSFTINVGGMVLISLPLELNWQHFSLRGCRAKRLREQTDSRIKQTWVQILTLTFSGYSNLDKLLDFRCIKWDYIHLLIQCLTLWWALFHFLSIW